jgi:hypothetical protein
VSELAALISVSSEATDAECCKDPSEELAGDWGDLRMPPVVGLPAFGFQSSGGLFGSKERTGLGDQPSHLLLVVTP